MTGPTDDSTDTARMRAAAASAGDAFWAALAAAFPEASSGDLTPGQVTRWEKARDEAVSAWVANNVPDASADGKA